jgi:hypothetical protein
MAVRRIQYDETGNGGNSGDNNVDNIDNGGSGGGGYSGGSGGSGGGSGVTTNTYVFSIQVNEDTFSSFVNNSIQPTPKVVRITKESLAVGPKKIEVKKKGYVAQECYIISMIDDDVPIIDRPNGESPLGLNQKQIQVQKYIGDTLDGPARIIQSSTRDLIFTLNQAEIIDTPKLHKIKFNISGKGSPVSILKNSTKNAEFFPIAGETNYKDISGTTYKITSSNSKLFRITDIVINKVGAASKELKAEPNESLEALITLNANYIVSITTEKVEPVQPALNPIISLVKDEERRYNINTKAGVPLLIQRNSDVKAITLIIGDDVMEFDDLGDDNIVGITIPETSFKKIGKYEIKLFPFSFEDYENSIREEVEEDTDTNLEEVIITPKKKKKKVLKEEKVVIPEEKAEDLYNPYNPTIGPINNDGRNGGNDRDGRNERGELPNNEIRDNNIYR